MTPFSAKDIADHLRSAERLASQADRLAEHFAKQAEIHRERAARFRAEAAGWSQLAAPPLPRSRQPSREGSQPMRLWLAKKLASEVFREAEKFDYLRRRIEELRTWCGYEFPLIDKAVQWAQRSTRVHYMSSEEFNLIVDSGDGASIAVGDISRFREDLRRERDASSTLTPGA